MKFKAFRINQAEGSVSAGFEELTIDDLSAGEVVIKVSYSGVNYKDALAATGKGRILRKFPLVGGIDLSGKVSESSDPRFKSGDSVLVCGAGLSEFYDGGFAEVARVKADSVVKIPDGLSEFEVMALGTAGYTAGIAVQRMQDNGQLPERGPIIVTGATGGVGSFAVDMLANQGYEVVAFTGKQNQHGYLQQLGAGGFIDRHSVTMGAKPLEKAEWGGAVDNVGGEVLSWLTRVVNPWGSIASVGLAGGIKLETTVMPFILRGVSILGINSVEMPLSVRAAVWERLASDLKPRHFDAIVRRVVDLDALPTVFDDYMNSTVVGRTVVEINP